MRRATTAWRVVAGVVWALALIVYVLTGGPAWSLIALPAAGSLAASGMRPPH
jgi:hypothetical protein